MKIINLLEKRGSSNTSEAALMLIKTLRIPVTATTVIETIESHPDFPSLYSISDSFDQWKVDNAAFLIDSNDLDELPVPFLAHTKRNGGSFVMVNKINGHISLINEQGKKETVSRHLFLNLWTRSALFAERNVESGEKDFAAKKRKELFANFRIPLLIVLTFGLIISYAAVFNNTPFGLASSALLLIKLIGIIVTGLLLWFEIDKNNPTLQQICTGNKKTNCTAVLGSKAAKLFNKISWSEIGFFYFAGSFLAIITSADNPSFIFPAIAWLNIFCLPYTVFSIFYQWKVAKQWCPLCLTVQALLLGEAILTFFSYWSIGSPLSAGLLHLRPLPVLVSFFLPIGFWIATKTVYTEAQGGKRYRSEFVKMKYNREIFSALLSKQRQINHPMDHLGIFLGDRNAPFHLVKVCNPYCGPCAKAHVILHELLESGKVNLRIIFTAADDDQDIKAPPVKHLMALNEKGDSQLIQKALDDWYLSNDSSYDHFKAKYPLKESVLNQQSEKLAAMKKWCQDMSISFTPTIFINGHQLPNIYHIKDLKKIL